jgi:hypothetical protein
MGGNLEFPISFDDATCGHDRARRPRGTSGDAYFFCFFQHSPRLRAAARIASIFDDPSLPPPLGHAYNLDTFVRD